MGLLGRSTALAFALASGCYSPDVRDCTVSCVAETDCIAGQVCGSDRLCAAPAVAGHCANLPEDGGVGGRDAGVVHVDATPVSMPDAPPDAPPAPTTTTLHAKVDGQGVLTFQGIGSCAAGAPQNGDCSFVVPIGNVTSAHADPFNNWQFDKWTTVPCLIEQSSTCNFTVLGPTDVHVKFRKDD